MKQLPKVLNRGTLTLFGLGSRDQVTRHAVQNEILKLNSLRDWDLRRQPYGTEGTLER